MALGGDRRRSIRRARPAGGRSRLRDGGDADRRGRHRLRPRRDTVPLPRRTPQLDRTGRPALDKVYLACGVDRSKADVAAHHQSVPSYSEYLRAASNGPPPPTSWRRAGPDRRRRRRTHRDDGRRLLRPLPQRYRGVPGRDRDARRPEAVRVHPGRAQQRALRLPRRTIYADLERTGLAPYLDSFVTSVDIGLRKPHRAAFEWLAATLGVALHEMAYVGNLPTDVTGALACGCTPIFLDRIRSGTDYGQASTVHSLREVPPLLTPIFGR